MAGRARGKSAQWTRPARDAPCSAALRRLCVGKDRTEQSLEKFFALIGQPLAGKVEFDCSDR